MSDLIDRQAVLDGKMVGVISGQAINVVPVSYIKTLPPAQPEYEPVTAEDFAKTMSENTIYGFMAWHGEALALMKGQGFVICKRRI